MKVIALAALVLAGASALAAQEPVYKAGTDGVKHPQVVYEKKPSYTAEAMRKKIQGSVEVGAIVDRKGKPTEVKILKSLDSEYGLDKKAVDAVKAWRFKPGTKDGKAVATEIKIELTFTLRDPK